MLAPALMWRPDAELLTELRTDGLQRGIALLLRAHEYACRLHCDAWQFAVEIREMYSLGLTNSELRWLLCSGMVEHGEEILLPEEDRRTFRTVNNLALTPHTCFVLTSHGHCMLTLAHRSEGLEKERPATLPGAAEKPVWNGQLRQLSWRGQVVKRFRVPALNQERILATFQEDSWPLRIDDPLPPPPEHDPKERLHEAIRALNRNQLNRCLRFRGDGTGRGVIWENCTDTLSPADNEPEFTRT